MQCPGRKDTMGSLRYLVSGPLSADEDLKEFPDNYQALGADLGKTMIGRTLSMSPMSKVEKFGLKPKDGWNE
jgi:hypothetical protein